MPLVCRCIEGFVGFGWNPTVLSGRPSEMMLFDLQWCKNGFTQDSVARKSGLLYGDLGFCGDGVCAVDPVNPGPADNESGVYGLWTV